MKDVETESLSVQFSTSHTLGNESIYNKIPRAFKISPKMYMKELYNIEKHSNFFLGGGGMGLNLTPRSLPQ